MSIDHEIMLGDLGQEGQLTLEEMAVRDLFVTEYLKDYNPIAACRRLGFDDLIVREYATGFMVDTYVQRQLSARQLIAPDDKDAEIAIDKRIIRAALFQEAQYYGPGSSHAARVSALSRLAQLYAMETDLAPSASESGYARGGVMEVPGLLGVDDWESASQASQGKLQNDVRT